MRLLLTITCSLLAIHAVLSQEFINLDFQELCDSSQTGLCHWDLSWGPEGSVQPESNGDTHMLLLEGDGASAVRFVEQAVSIAESADLHVLSISSLVKSQEIIGRGAGLNIGLYDSEGNMVGYKDMGAYYSIAWITGTNTWDRRSISIVCPRETRLIKVGMILYGQGKAWFSDFQAELIPLKGRNPSALATRYVSAACDTIKMHSLVRDSIDIGQLRQTALQVAGPAIKTADCYLAIEYLLGSLITYGDDHSFFMTPEEVKNWETEGSRVSEIQYPTGKLIDDCGYILVPPFHGGNQEVIVEYADSLQRIIERLDKSNIKGWIVDLRENTGGNMEPMIAGLGPLFSSEKLGSLVDINGNAEAWYYSGGRYYFDGYEGWRVTQHYEVKERLPIAILTSDQTGSSGEIVAISFIGNERTRSFGTPTWGLTTGNGEFTLEDGAHIRLASTVMADRNDIQYTSSIAPDVLIQDDPNTTAEEIMEIATRWIRNQ